MKNRLGLIMTLLLMVMSVGRVEVGLHRPMEPGRISPR